MPDLSSMLGDVYESDDDADTPPPIPSESSDAPDRGVEGTADDEHELDRRDMVAPTAAGEIAAPDWADDDRLDEAFSDWTPGPSADASDEEREMMAGAADEANGVIEPMPADRAEELLHEPDEDWEPPELTAPEPPREGGPKPAPVPQATDPWARDDDDILPGGGPIGLLARLLR